MILPPVVECPICWGSHGCTLPRKHDGPHFCCCDCDNHPDPGSGCVGTAPYYGDKTQFFSVDDLITADPLATE